MSTTAINSARVSLGQKLAATQHQLSRTQVSLMDVQSQLATGKRLSQVSDDPGSAAIILQLRKVLADRQSYASNLQGITSNLGQVDTTLGNLTDVLRQAQQIASANVGSIVSANERTAAASVVSSLYDQIFSFANTQFQGSFLFGGDRNTTAPYVSQLGGIRFVGSSTQLANRVDESTSLNFTASGPDIFGGLSGQVRGTADLTPNLTNNTLLTDLRGANGDGVHLGSIVLSDGSTSTSIDLSSAKTVGDILTLINNAAVGGISASLNGTGISLNASPSDDITVTEGGGTTAADLGILQTTSGGPGQSVSGSSVQPSVTLLTNLGDLRGGLGFDPAGFIITNGAKSATIDPSTAVTVQDLFNLIQSANVGAVGQVKPDGSGIDILNAVQGTSMTITENGGTTASDLGIRSFSPQTLLSDLNGGRGVGLVSGNDMQITQSDGQTFQVDLTGAMTIADVIAAINSASLGGITAAFSTTSNGIELTDSAGGAGVPKVQSINNSTAAADLGLDVTATGSVLTGRDVNPVQADGIFSSLAGLRDALLHNDQAAITAAAAKLQTSLDTVVRVRGQVGATVQEAENRQERLADQNLATQSMLSSLEDVDYNEAITKFQTLQTALQAQLQTTGRILSTSLLDYL